MAPVPQSFHLSQWHRFATPRLMVAPAADDEINIFGPCVTEETAELWQFFFDTQYHTSDVSFREALAATDASHITLLINSPGGDVFAGSAIRSQIQSEQAQGRTFTAHIIGLAASAAALIALAPTRTIIADTGMIMIHRASLGYDAWGWGNQEDLQVVINQLESYKASLREIDRAQIKIFQERTGLEREQVQELLRKESWFNAESALEKKFVHAIQPATSQPDLAASDRLPQGFAPTPTGGLRHPAPALSFAAALTAPPKASPKHPDPGVPPMYEKEVRKLLTLPDSQDVTPAHQQEAIGLLLSRNESLARQIAKEEKKSLLTQAKATFDKHVQRGAITPFQAASTVSMIMSAADPEEQLALQDEIYRDLPDGDHGGTTPRQPLGLSQEPTGADDKTDDQATLAHTFKKRLDSLVDEGLTIAQAQDQAAQELDDDTFQAYLYYDFDAERQKGA